MKERLLVRCILMEARASSTFWGTQAPFRQRGGNKVSGWHIKLRDYDKKGPLSGSDSKDKIPLELFRESRNSYLKWGHLHTKAQVRRASRDG